MTEDEAKTKWCPFGRFPEDVWDDQGNITGAVAVNRGRGPNELNGSLCVGSKCMAWRVMKSDPEKTGHCGLVNR